MNAIRRTVIMVISLIYLLSISPVQAFALNDESMSIDLATISETSSDSFTVMDSSEFSQQETIDLSHAIDVTEELISIKSKNEEEKDNQTELIPYAIPENQPPVADPAIFVVNPETERDGSYTTATVFFIATRWNNTDLCYDPEGGDISLAYDDSFPGGYITYINEDTFTGYRIQIYNRGQYPFIFAFTDDYGGMSEIFTINFDIISRGVFTPIQGSLDSMTDIKEYDISVDYSVADEYSIGLLRVGKSVIVLDVYDENGEKCNTACCDGQNINDKVVLKKPDGINREYTYKLKVGTAPSEEYYVDGDSNFRIAYGQSSQLSYFFEEVYDSIDLPYYHTVRGSNRELGVEPVGRLPISDCGNYYKISTTGTERVTLTSTDEHVRFKILDVRTLRTLFDSRNLLPLSIENSITKIPTYYVGLDINFEAGTSYYLCVYDPSPNSTYRSYAITVGEPKMFSGYRTINIPDRTVSAGTTYTATFNLAAVNDGPMYVDRIGYHGYSVDWAPEGGHFSVLSPGKSTWVTNILYHSNIEYNYWDSDTVPVRADGEWALRFTAAKSGTCTGRWVRIFYATELSGYDTAQS